MVQNEQVNTCLWPLTQLLTQPSAAESVPPTVLQATMLHIHACTIVAGPLVCNPNHETRVLQPARLVLMSHCFYMEFIVEQPQ